jgi:hypothetical protein
MQVQAFYSPTKPASAGTNKNILTHLFVLAFFQLLENASDFCGHQQGAPTNMSILGMSFGAQLTLVLLYIKNRSPKNQMKLSHRYQRIENARFGCDDGGRGESPTAENLERGTEHSCVQQAWLVASVG